MANNVIYCASEWTSQRRQTEPYTELASAIVLRAVTDYTCTLIKLFQNNSSVINRKALTHQLLSLERFFYSTWCELLCDISPETLLKGCQRTVRLKLIGREHRV